jgi:hypothetical protein
MKATLENHEEFFMIVWDPITPELSKKSTFRRLVSLSKAQLSHYAIATLLANWGTP